MNTINHKKVFVFAKKNIRISDDLFIDKDDVGIVETKTEKGALIFFIRVWKIAELDNDDFKIFDVKKTGDAFPKKICNICHKVVVIPSPTNISETMIYYVNGDTITK